jgi:hypothetical protein
VFRSARETESPVLDVKSNAAYTCAEAVGGLKISAPRAPFNCGDLVLATVAAARRRHRRHRLFRPGFELAMRKLEDAAREATTSERPEKVG